MVPWNREPARWLRFPASSLSVACSEIRNSWKEGDQATHHTQGYAARTSIYTDLMDQSAKTRILLRGFIEFTVLIYYLIAGLSHANTFFRTTLHFFSYLSHEIMELIGDGII